MRNDLLATPEGVAQWCNRIAGIVDEAMSDSAVRLAFGVVKVRGD